MSDLYFELSKHLENFSDNCNFELEASDCDNSTKDLIEQIARQTHSLLSSFRDSLENHLK